MRILRRQESTQSLKTILYSCLAGRILKAGIPEIIPGLIDDPPMALRTGDAIRLLRSRVRMTLVFQPGLLETPATTFHKDAQGETTPLSEMISAFAPLKARKYSCRRVDDLAVSDREANLQRVMLMKFKQRDIRVIADFQLSFRGLKTQ